MAGASEKRNFLWIDMEMSGLDVEQCRILEVAAIITDENFQEIAHYEAVVYQPEEVLNAMDEWCTTHHGASGLTAAVKTGKNEGAVQEELLALINQYFSTEDRPVLCGNSIGQDRKFIDRYWPKLAKRLHYRMVDVTSYKEIFRSCYGIEHKKNGGHRALGDIRESIAELRHYLSFVQVPKS